MAKRVRHFSCFVFYHQSINEQRTNLREKNNLAYLMHLGKLATTAASNASLTTTVKDKFIHFNLCAEIQSVCYSLYFLCSSI